MRQDEGIWLLLEIKKEDKRKRGQWEGGETEDPALWDSSVCFGGGQSGSVCRTSPDTNRRDAVSCTLCVCVCACACVCSETRPTSDPCAAHTPPSAAQESAFCSFCAQRVCVGVCEGFWEL